MRSILFVCVLLTTSFFAVPGAEARGKLGIINYGDEIFDMGPVEATQPDVRIGRFCQHFGFLWADIITWDCRLVFTNTDLTRYGELPADAKADIEKRFADVTPQRSFWNRYGIFIIVLIIGLFVWRSAAGRREQAS